MKHYQLVIIGAGPAGGYAALTAARAGLEVLAVERGQVVGEPLCCAEAVSDYGFRKFMPAEPAFIATDVTAIAFSVSSGYEYKHQFDDIVGYVLQRPHFDRHLSELAVRAGVRLKTGNYASGIRLTEGKPAEIDLQDERGKVTILADYVIAADGVESMIGRMAGLDTCSKLHQTDATLQYRVTDIEVDPHCLEFCVGRTYAPGGYVWVFPKSDHSANIGLGINPTRNSGEELKSCLDRFLRNRYRSYRVESVHCGNVPKYVGPRLFGRENLILAGDAARTLDSVTGAGITKAMHTGSLAARAVASAINDKISRSAMQKLYRKMISTEIGSELRFCQKIYPVIRKFTEEDWETLIRFLRKFVEKEKAGSRIDPVVMVRSAFTSAPRLIRLARHIF